MSSQPGDLNSTYAEKIRCLNGSNIIQNKNRARNKRFTDWYIQYYSESL